MCRCGQSFLFTIRRAFHVVLRGFPFLQISFLLVPLLLLSAYALAQDASTGALRGVVVDAQGAVIRKGDIVAIRVSTGIRYHAATDSEGRFVVDLLPPGNYSARAVAEGMSPEITPVITVEVGAATRITFKMQVAGPKETITVSDTPQTSVPDPSSVSALVDEKAIQDLPLNGRRFTDLLLLSPGVTQDPRGLTSGSNGDLSYGGIRGYNTSFLIDGLDDNNAFYAQAIGRYHAPYQFSDEVIQEFRVQSSGYGAESGRAGGAVVNVVTKSGTNTWHGTAFYHLRDSELGGAAPPFVGFNPANEQHQFGATIGGPIQRSKTFLFAGYDQHIFNVPAMVEFDNGQTVVVPQPGVYPTPGDYENCNPSIGGIACDEALVFAAAAQLSTMGGLFRAKLLGQTGFAKIDRVLASHEFLTARFNISRSYGDNNVFFDPGSPISFSAINANGEEEVSTESASLSLLSGISPRLTSHLRLQFSRDLEQQFPNTIGAQTSIYSWMEDFGQSASLPHTTREHRIQLAETLSLTRGRNQWKFGADAMATWDYDYFPSLLNGEYFYDDISVNPFTFVPMEEGLKLTPLRAWAHNVPRYYEQNFANPVAHPNGLDYAAFIQDTARVTPHFSLSAGVRYDLQLFSRVGMVTNPLWSQVGKMPLNATNFAPRVGIGYSLGSGEKPIMVRAGFGFFFTRIPQSYQSAVINDNGISDNFISLDNQNYYDAQVFPAYPNPAVKCQYAPVACPIPAQWQQYATSQVAAFAPNFKTPRVQQGSLSMERQLAHGFSGTVSYLFVHGVDMIRARDVNLPPPTYYSYPIFNSTDSSFTNTFYNVWSFANWQTSYSISCPYPPCINTLSRPITQLGAIDQFESASSSVYNGMTVSLRRRFSNGLFFNLGYTWAHAIDDGQDALVTLQPVTVQNSYNTKAERGPSVTDQRQRLTISAIEEPHWFADGQTSGRILNHWKLTGIMTYGSGRPANAMVSGDPNQDGNLSNDRLSGYGRDAFTGPDYATLDLKTGRIFTLGEHTHLEFTAESYNAFNRDNQRLQITDNGFQGTAGQFIKYTLFAGSTYYPAYYQQPTSLMKPSIAFAPRQMQFSMRFNF